LGKSVARVSYVTNCGLVPIMRLCGFSTRRSVKTDNKNCIFWKNGKNYIIEFRIYLIASAIVR